MRALSSLLAALAVATASATPESHGPHDHKRPNILFLMSDDQDIRLGSMEYMDTLQKEMLNKGTSFLNHHTTTAQCCPSRVSLLRGQAAHNTNVTNVFAPGGNYEKFRLSGQGDDYMPHWMSKQGYRSEYLGKFLNGVNLLNWQPPPPGWDHVDIFVEPYQTTPNRVVMSENGNTPVAFLGYHQTDVIRAKALDRLEHLTRQTDPWFLFISPTAPHVDDETGITEPCTRHNTRFPDAKAPRTPSFNPPDEIQNNKASWIRDLIRMDKGNESWSDFEFRNRAQALVGIDEMLGDMLALLEKKGELDNTYVIYTSDNGYHLGQHRMAVGKATPFVEDTNLPFVVRGPGIPKGVNSSLVSAHLDLAPTFLDIAGVDVEHQPSFFDGRSLLEQWKNPDKEFDGAGQGNNREVLNVEYWGSGNINVQGFVQTTGRNTYKTLRIVGDGIGYLYSHWCESNEVELYDTVVDPYEITNLARNPDAETQRLMTRLNAMLLVTKSCSEMSCRNTWETLTADSDLEGTITTLKQALDPKYDEFFASIPKVNVAECLGVQLASNEMPFWPPGSGVPDLGLSSRNMTDSLGPSYKFFPMLGNEKPEGGMEQRHANLKEIMKKARKLTKEELDPLQPRILRSSNSGYTGPGGPK